MAVTKKKEKKHGLILQSDLIISTMMETLSQACEKTCHMTVSKEYASKSTLRVQDIEHDKIDFDFLHILFIVVSYIGDSHPPAI